MKSRIFQLFQSPITWFVVLLAAIGVFTAIGPAEKTLGANARIVYLHGVWVWTALAGFVAAGCMGLAGIITRRPSHHAWSRALGRTGLFFWVTYLPISMWAMQTSWNGLYLAEPRWRLAMVFAISGLLMQAGLALMDSPQWTSAANFGYVVILFVILQNTQNVMHPPSPILNTDAARIQIYFAGLLILALLTAWQVARWWLRTDHSTAQPR